MIGLKTTRKQFFTTKRHKALVIQNFSQSYFAVPKRTIRNIKKTFLFKVVELFYTAIAGFGMSYDDFRDLCRDPWKDEDCKYNYIVRYKK